MDQSIYFTVHCPRAPFEYEPTTNPLCGRSIVDSRAPGQILGANPSPGASKRSHCIGRAPVRRLPVSYLRISQSSGANLHIPPPSDDSRGIAPS